MAAIKTYKPITNGRRNMTVLSFEEIYNVKVVDIATIRVLPKRRRVGKYEGYRSAYKKAICKLAEGNKIDAFNI
jgi:large subunit ribosomal protein L23